MALLFPPQTPRNTKVRESEALGEKSMPVLEGGILPG